MVLGTVAKGGGRVKVWCDMELLKIYDNVIVSHCRRVLSRRVVGNQRNASAVHDV
jgi:hypothetical protein